MSETSPWDDISVPSAELNVRLVAGETAVPCYWGRDIGGACLFIVELHGDYTDQFRRHSTVVKGIDVDLRSSEAGKQRLVLTLDRQVDRDLFEGLCRTLSTALARASDSSSSLAVALAHIKRWKAFLSGAGHTLSSNEVRGLFAELTYLLELADRCGSTAAAVEAWLGPDRSHQDFIFGNTSVEIKSLSGTERSSVHISSEDQLEALNDHLFLRVYRLSDLPESAAALSLNEIVTRVHGHLEQAEALDAFDRKLVAQRYAPMPDYDEPKFVVSGVETFRVAGDFPRIVRSLLPSGIATVGYDIKLEALVPYVCENEAAFGGHDGSDG